MSSLVTRKYLALRVVEPGMIIDQAIIDRAGRVLIARRKVLEEFHIAGLKKMGVAGIYIREGEDDPEEEKKKEEPKLPETIQKKYDEVKVDDPAKVKLSESVRKRVVEGIQYLYQDTGSDDFTNATKSITEDLMKAISENDAVWISVR